MNQYLQMEQTEKVYEILLKLGGDNHGKHFQKTEQNI